jgi:hypothetical protein
MPIPEPAAMPDPALPDPEALLAALLPATGILPDPAWQPAIVANLRVAAAIALALQGLALPETTEPAPVFEPGR